MICQESLYLSRRQPHCEWISAAPAGAYAVVGANRGLTPRANFGLSPRDKRGLTPPHFGSQQTLAHLNGGSQVQFALEGRLQAPNSQQRISGSRES
jgi:hypothetical protein